MVRVRWEPQHHHHFLTCGPGRPLTSFAVPRSGPDLVARLQQPEGLSAFILMQKILPPAQVRGVPHFLPKAINPQGAYGTPGPYFG